MRLIRTTYDIATYASAEAGDFDEIGWIDKEGVEIIPDEYDIEKHDGELGAIVAMSVKAIADRGPVEASSNQYRRGVWYTEIDCNFHEPRYSFHLEGFSEEEEAGIYDALTKRR